MSRVWDEPKYLRATLIQALSGFLGELEPHLSDLIKKYELNPKFKHECIKWIMAEELWHCYLISVNEHRKADPYVSIYDELKNRLPFELSQCFMNYFMVPTFADRGHSVGVDVGNLGFVLRYYTHAIQPMARTLKNEPDTNQKEHSLKYLRTGLESRI